MLQWEQEKMTYCSEKLWMLLLWRCQGHAWWMPGQPDLVSDLVAGNPVHCMGAGTRWSLKSLWTPSHSMIPWKLKWKSFRSTVLELAPRNAEFHLSIWYGIKVKSKTTFMFFWLLFSTGHLSSYNWKYWLLDLNCS